MKTKKYFLALALLATLTACEATVKDAYVPDGAVGKRIDCGGLWFDYDDCAEAASETCGPAGYTVLGKFGEEQVYESQAFGINDTEESTTDAVIEPREMLVRCN